jgi:cytochrome d ubiquinol oxidase subunit II
VDLASLWFIAIAVLWTGYFFLDGFDFGVGVLLPVLGRTEEERRTLIDTIGGVWDGNEVWLIVAAGATFAAFPLWYATMFSSLYVLFLVILVALIVRGVAFEFRGGGETQRWRATWDRLLVAGSLVPAVLWGVVFGNIARGLPLDADHLSRAGLGELFNWHALVGGLVTLTLFLLHGALFLRLRTAGDLRARARRAAAWIAPPTLLATAVFLVWTQALRGTTATMVLGAVAVVCVLGAWALNRTRRAGAGFAFSGAAVAAATATLFLALYPAVLPSTINPAFDLTVHNASSSPYTLTIMTWAAGVFLPIVVAYQVWSYWVFARRIGVVAPSRDDEPSAHRWHWGRRRPADASR